MFQKPWTADSKIRAWARAHRTLEEIADLNEQETGWKPSRMAVSDKLRAIGEEPRKGSRNLLRSLGKIKKEHRSSPLYYIVAAEDRRRERQETGQPLSRTDQKWLLQMNEKIFQPNLVVGYHRDLGFYLQPRTDDDDDFVRVWRPGESVEEEEEED